MKSGGRWLSDEMNEAIIGATFPTWGEICQKMIVDALPPVSATLRPAELAASTVPLRVGGRMEPVASKKTWRKSGGTENYVRMNTTITGAFEDGVEVKTNKNAHHFQKETVSKRDNNLSLVFLISSREEQWSGLVNLYEMNYCDKGDRPPLSPEGGNFLPFGEVRRGRFPKSSSISENCLNPLVLQGQSGLVANKIKSSAYET